MAAGDAPPFYLRLVHGLVDNQAYQNTVICLFQGSGFAIPMPMEEGLYLVLGRVFQYGIYLLESNLCSLPCSWNYILGFAGPSARGI